MTSNVAEVASCSLRCLALSLCPVTMPCALLHHPAADGQEARKSKEEEAEAEAVQISVCPHDEHGLPRSHSPKKAR